MRNERVCRPVFFALFSPSFQVRSWEAIWEVLGRNKQKQAQAAKVDQALMACAFVKLDGCKVFTWWESDDFRPIWRRSPSTTTGAAESCPASSCQLSPKLSASFHHLIFMRPFLGGPFQTPSVVNCASIVSLKRQQFKDEKRAPVSNERCCCFLGKIQNAKQFSKIGC